MCGAGSVGPGGEHWPLLQARTSWLTSVGLSGDQWGSQGTITATDFLTLVLLGLVVVSQRLKLRAGALCFPSSFSLPPVSWFVS